MSLPLWMSIEPELTQTRLQLCEPQARAVLRARLPAAPQHPRALITLLESLSLWYTALQKATTKNDSPSALLDSLMREQLRVVIEERAKAALKRSAIFPLSMLDSYDFDYPKQIDKALVMKAASLDFVRDKANVVFVGPSGVGKTHLANAIAQLACLRGLRVRFVTAADLVNDLVAAQARNTLARRIHTWTTPDLLLIDELGYLSFDARGADLLYQVINRRYQRASTIITTNLPFKDWGKLFHNTAAASAIADRLVHKGILVRITGTSFRTNQNVEE